MIDWQWIEVVFGLWTVVVCVPLLVLLVECGGAIFPPPRQPLFAPRPRIDVLVPAHNEQDVLEATLRAVQLQLVPGDRLVVVADNCRDQTAEIARRCGAIVIERENDSERGKGYAIRFGLQHLADDPAEIVVIVDADCRFDPGALDRLVTEASASGCAVQACYGMTAPSPATPCDQLSQWAVTVKNLVRPLGLARLGLPCLLTGSGMAFPWHTLGEVMRDDATLDAGHLVEDMQLSVEMWIAGDGPLFCPDAQVTAPLPGDRAAAMAQRTRWEHGHLQTLTHSVPRLLGHALRKRRPQLLALALDLAIPPLSLLALIWCATSLAALAWGSITGNFWYAGLLLLTGMSSLALTILACRRYEVQVEVVPLLRTLPVYAMSKLPIYFGFLLRRKRAWVRTAREPLPAPHLPTPLSVHQEPVRGKQRHPVRQ